MARVPRFESSYNGNRRNSAPQTAAPSTAANGEDAPADDVESSSPPPPLALTQDNLTEVHLDTPVPIFGTNRIQLQVRDLVSVPPAPSVLNRIRGNLREYILTTFDLQTPITEENLDEVRYNNNNNWRGHVCRLNE